MSPPCAGKQTNKEGNKNKQRVKKNNLPLTQAHHGEPPQRLLRRAGCHHRYLQLWLAPHMGLYGTV